MGLVIVSTLLGCCEIKGINICKNTIISLSHSKCYISDKYYCYFYFIIFIINWEYFKSFKSFLPTPWSYRPWEMFQYWFSSLHRQTFLAFGLSGIGTEHKYRTKVLGKDSRLQNYQGTGTANRSVVLDESFIKCTF